MIALEQKCITLDVLSWNVLPKSHQSYIVGPSRTHMLYPT
jgi:hypothetical protein